MDLTFKDFLRILDEDLEGDISKLQADISMLDSEIAKRTQPLMQNKIRLQKMLAVKQKQQQAEARKGGNNMTAQGEQTGSQTTTPGSAGAATPGQTK